MKLSIICLFLACLASFAAVKVRSPKGAELFPDPKPKPMLTRVAPKPWTNRPFALTFRYPTNAAQFHWWTLEGSTHRPPVTNDAAWFIIASNLPWSGALGVGATNGTASFQPGPTNIFVIALTNRLLSLRMKGATNIPKVWR